MIITEIKTILDILKTLLNFRENYKNVFLSNKDVFLNYNTSEIISFYHNIPDILKDKENQIYAPYQIMHIFTENDIKNGWADVEIIDHFDFPHLLLNHKEIVIDLFNKQKKLEKGNLKATRIVDFVLENNFPKIVAQPAMYYDQVGTNLSLDYKLPNTIDDCQTLREWDIKQSNIEIGKITPFNKSKLANTLGIAIGITAKNSKNQDVVLTRLRTNKTAVYPNMWHLPFSFAHCPESKLKSKRFKLKEFIDTDFQSELYEELGLLVSDFHDPVPFAFCRDLVRGGKPQLFIEMKSKLSYEEIQKKIKNNSNEFKKSVKEYEDAKTLYSPELEAFVLLKDRFA